jgi:hypothetical protein
MRKNPKRNFIKIDESIDPNEISTYFLNLLLITQIDKEYSTLKGIFTYKSKKDDYEIDILIIFNKFCTNSNKKNFPFTLKNFLFSVIYYYVMKIAQNQKFILFVQEQLIAKLIVYLLLSDLKK